METPMNTQTVRAFVVIPAYNEAPGISGFLENLSAYLQLLCQTRYPFAWTILVVNDGSSDSTESILEDGKRLTESSPVRIDYISLVRNFGHQAALLAGLQAVVREQADFAITMDADGEHPIELIASLVSHWMDGAPLVHTKREKDARLSRFKNLTSSLYYGMLRKLGQLDIQDGMADYKLWDGSLLRQVEPFFSTCGSTRAFASWLVSKAPVVSYQQNFVPNRVSRFTLSKMISMAVNGLVSYSEVPIRLAFYTGFLSIFVGALLVIQSIWAYFVEQAVPGWTTTVALIVLFGGAQCFLLGIYGEYFLRNVFRAKLPKFVVKKVILSSNSNYTTGTSAASRRGSFPISTPSRESGAEQ